MWVDEIAKHVLKILWEMTGLQTQQKADEFFAGAKVVMQPN